MLDLLSPLRGYIAQNLQFYLSKYIEDIQLEGLGLFGGDLVLNDLEIKRHVLRESLDIPSSFDFSRGFIRELRIHIPWTQLLSQPIEVKLYTIELILTAKSDTQQRVARGAPTEKTATSGEEHEQEKIEQPKSGWIHDTLEKILANISVQVNNLVLKYEHDDVVFSIALGTLEFYSASEIDEWTRSFEELKGRKRVICKRIDAKDVTIFLDRYTNDGKYNTTQAPVRRNVAGYEVPVLSRTSASVRAKLQLFSTAAMEVQEDHLSSPKSLLHQQQSSTAHGSDTSGGSIIDVDGLFAYRPSMTCDPFYYYSCNRSRVTPRYEVDVFIGELLFSVSDRQLKMLNQLITSASRKMDQAQEQNCDRVPSSDNSAKSFAAFPTKPRTASQKVHSSTKRQESWLGWAMNALGTADDEKDDELISELLAETRGAMLKTQRSLDSNVEEDLSLVDEPLAKTSCVRLCIGSASMTLRKHQSGNEEKEHQDSTIAESEEELVPVANLGMVKVMTTQRTKRKAARPAVPILNLMLSYVALEMLLPRGEEQSGMDLVLEIETMELTSATVNSNKREDFKDKKGQVLLQWGSMDSMQVSDCVSHPYFINSFFSEETTRLNRRETQSFDLVKVSLNAAIPVWKTMETSTNVDERQKMPCDCFTTWNGEVIPCLPLVTVAGVCQDAVRIIGIKERVLDGGILSNAVSTAWASSGFSVPISEHLTRALVSVADEYRAHRNPDIGALENLQQLLQPHLIALFSRCTLHSCSASFLHSSSQSSNIWARGAHSALRLRLASTSILTDCKDSVCDRDGKQERLRKVLDVSIGDGHVVFEPSKCVELMEASTIFLHRNESDKTKTEGATIATSCGIKSMMESDIKLITIGSVDIQVSDKPAASKPHDSMPSSHGDLNLIARGFAWLETCRPGSSQRHVELDTLSAHFQRSPNASTPLTLMEVLGLEFRTTKSSTNGDANDDVVANINKVRTNLCVAVAQDVALMMSNVLSPLGYPIAWKSVKKTSKIEHMSFEIEVCGAAFSRTISCQLKRGIAQRQSLGAEIAAVSINVARRGSKRQVRRCIVQGGVAPMMVRGPEFGVPLFKFELTQEKSSGGLHAVPLLDSLGFFSLNPDSLAATCTHCHFVITAQLATVFVDAQGALQLVDVVSGLVRRIRANLPLRKGTNLQREHKTKDERSMDIAPTNWSLTIALKAAGAHVRVNDALQLNVPLLSISSVDTDTSPSLHVKAGGVVKVECTMKDAAVSVSDNGLLKGLQDPRVLSIQDVCLVVEFSHDFAARRHTYAVDITLSIAAIQASLSRLKLLYLFKLPSSRAKDATRTSSIRQVAPSQETQDQANLDRSSTASNRWHYRLGAQVDCVKVVCTADIDHQSVHGKQQVQVVVDGKVSNIAIAARVGNYHPMSVHIQPTRRSQSFTDIQMSLGDVHVVERLGSTRQELCTVFGEFSRLPEHAFLGILVCLELSELKCLVETVCGSSTSRNTSDQQPVHSAMLSWHLTSCIAKAFQEASAKEHKSKHKQPVATIPLLIAWKDSAGPTTAPPFPLVSGFYRNYSDNGFPHDVIAGSMESIDIAVTRSSLCCLASVADVRERRSDPFELHVMTGSEHEATSRVPTSLSDAPRSKSLADIKVSLLCGQVRLIIPSESLMESLISARPVSRTVFIVLESLSMASAARNDIALDGLGYPPFNSRVLPRRPTVQAHRFGQSPLRIGCRAGKISGFVAGWDFDRAERTADKVVEGRGPFEDELGRTTGYAVHLSNVETFWLPFNVTCSLQEEPFAANDVEDPGVKTSAAVALTKLRLDLSKATFDVLISRIIGINEGFKALKRSIVKLKPVKGSTLQPSLPVAELKHQEEVSFSCDGVEVNVFEPQESIHVRIGAILVAHNLSTLSGSASVQYVAVGHRFDKGAQQGPEQDVIALENVVFGANAEPSLWQLAVENYPEKLIAARWNFGDRSEGTLFLDVQASQVHVSHHFLMAVARFGRFHSSFSFSRPSRGEKRKEERQRKSFVFCPRWKMKLLVAPSVMSYWRANGTEGGRSGVWITSGQLFVSLGVGSDDKAQQAVKSHGQDVNEITRYVAVPTLEAMVNIDKLGVNTSNDLPLLQVSFQNTGVGSIPTPSSSTWLRFSKYISVVSESQRLLHDCSVRITGQEHQMLERVAIAEARVYLFDTDMVRRSVQTEVNALCVKVSSFSLRAMQSLLATRDDSDPRHETSPRSACHNSNDRSTCTPSHALEKLEGSSSDDFKNLRRMAESRRPSPGELVFTETLLIETQSAMASAAAPAGRVNVQIETEPNSFDIKLSDVTAYLNDCNNPWTVEGHEASGERLASYTGLGNRTHGWMEMRWCYHMPRKVHKIVANPVPIPPIGVPNGWPSWTWDQDQDRDAGRLCDILCELRCWDTKRACYAVVCAFHVPWEAPSCDGLKDVNEAGTFGDLVSQWFDDGLEEGQYRSKMLEIGARTRAFSFESPLSSDNWELRWRTPLQSEQEPENKQRRLVVNALLASSLQVCSVLSCDAYQHLVASLTVPQITLSVSHVGPGNDSHDVITAELNDTTISWATSGRKDTKTVTLCFSSSIQAHLDNMAQLVTVPVVSSTSVDAMLESSAKGLQLSTLIGPVSVYLNQTTMLGISAIPKLLQMKQSSCHVTSDKPHDKLSNMRIKIVNSAGMDVWYRQEGTFECLLLGADTSATYSWLSLATSPFYQLCFALDDPSQEQTPHEQLAAEDSRWCDPCRIKDNAVTGRYFAGHGFLWICVELSGLQTIVTLRSALIVRNHCSFPVLFKVNEEASVFECTSSEPLYQDPHKSQRSHSNCISMDKSACTLSALAQGNGGVSCVMRELIASVEFALDGRSWCSVSTDGALPHEFDLVKVRDDQVDNSTRTQCSFATLASKEANELTQYVGVKIARVQCRTVLPTDFDPMQPQVSRRYTWMEVSLWPALSVENRMDIPLVLSFVQKAAVIKLSLAPSSEKHVSALNPCEAIDVHLHFPDSPQSAAKPLTFALKGVTYQEDSTEQVFVLEDCKVLVQCCNNRCPMVRIRAERVLTIANMTPNVLVVQIGSSLQDQRVVEQFASGAQRSIGFLLLDSALVLSMATITDSKQSEWSPQVALDVKCATKTIIVPCAGDELTSLASAYCLELITASGYLKLVIRPQVVLINATNEALMCVPTDGHGNSKAEPQLIAGTNAGWCVPVCLHKERKKRSITANMSSWLNSKLSRNPSDDMPTAPKQQFVARLSCSFQMKLVEDGYEWTEEIAVLLPKLSLVLTPDNKLKVDEASVSSTASTDTEHLYPSPSTTTHRRRLLVRHRAFRHKMLTYTITQTGKAIHMLLFVDHQPPVIIHNQWQRVVGFRNVSPSSNPEGVGAELYLEYDWDLQVATRQRRVKQKAAKEDPTDTKREATTADERAVEDWLEAFQSLPSTDVADTTPNDRTRFQLGLPRYGWSNVLWQVSGIQFASFSSDKESAMDAPSGPTFLVMCFYRAGSWLITITCLEDPTRDGPTTPMPPFVAPSTTLQEPTQQSAPPFLRLSLIIEELSLHFCDEYDPVRDDRRLITYPEVLRATCNTISIAFATAPDPPQVSRLSTRLGYLSHVRSYTTLFVSIDGIQVGHFLTTCNFPVLLSFPKTHEATELLQVDDRVKKHERLELLMAKLVDKQVPSIENASFLARVIYTDTWDPVGIPSYFHSIELHLSSAVLQVEDDILSCLNTFIRPILDAREGEIISNRIANSEDQDVAASHPASWSSYAYEAAKISKQRKVFIERFEISDLEVTITARVAIPVLNSFDGTPLRFGSTKMRDVFAFPDQLYKDLAANYVADTIVRSPLLLMSLNIIGNPAGFLRSFGQGVRDLIEIPLAASHNGYSPWALTKGVIGGVTSFLGHTTAATLTSVSGFSYSISRTMDQLTLSSEQLRRRHYTRPTHLSAALADGLGSLGSSVVGAAAGVISTPIALYKERQRQGLDTGIGNLVGGVGMGLVGIVARPVGGVASLVSMTSDGLLYGISGNDSPFATASSRFAVRPNELLRYKLKVLPHAVKSDLIFAHGLWLVSSDHKLIVPGQSLDFMTKEQVEIAKNEELQGLLRPDDTTHGLVRVTVVCTSTCLYVVGISRTQTQDVVAQTRLEAIEAVEESLQEPTVLDLGIRTPTSIEWLRFRLPLRQRRHLSHHLRLWLAA